MEKLKELINLQNQLIHELEFDLVDTSKHAWYHGWASHREKKEK